MLFEARKSQMDGDLRAGICDENHEMERSNKATRGTGHVTTYVKGDKYGMR